MSTCPDILFYHCCNLSGHMSANCPNKSISAEEERRATGAGEPRRCILCKGTHTRGQCPEAGKLTSAVAVCTVCRAYFRSSNTPPCETMHLFTKFGFVERDLCPYIVKITQSGRAPFLKSHEICTVCVTGRPHSPKECPDLEKFKLYLCTEPSCFTRKTMCPNPVQH